MAARGQRGALAARAALTHGAAHRAGGPEQEHVLAEPVLLHDPAQVPQHLLRVLVKRVEELGHALGVRRGADGHGDIADGYRTSCGASGGATNEARAAHRR